MKSLGVKVTFIVILTLLAGWLRLANLGAVNLYNDEFYQFETAVGQLRLGEWVRYDYYNEGAGKVYDRAKLFIWQVAASIRLFGENETAGRLPAALWGTLLIPVVVLLLLRVLKHDWIAYGTGVVLLFDDLSIGLSRYVRMYSMLMVLVTLLVICVYLLFEAKLWKQRLAYGAVTAMALLLSLHIFKELTLAIIAALGVYALLRAIAFIITRHPSDKPWLYVWCVGAGLAAVAIALTLAGYNVVPLDAVIVRTKPHWSYLTDLFMSWRVPVLAGSLALIGLVLSFKQLRSFLGVAATVSTVVLTYFAFFSHRWDAQRYVSIIVPWVSLLTVVGLVASIQFIYGLLPKPVWLRRLLLLPLVFMIGPWLSFPGLPGNDLTHITAKADYDTTELGYADMRSAYAYVSEHVTAGEVVLMQGPRFYYWPNRQVPVYLMGGYKSLTLAEFKALAGRGTAGGWVVFNVTHQRHLDDKIKAYMAKRFNYVSTLRDTNVVVYHFIPEDLAERKK